MADSSSVFDTAALSNPNSVWGAVAADVLVRLGVRAAVISPGSRSTPLAFAFARHPDLECLPVLDERSAGFLALGWARSSGAPVALVCTSGTAAANYYPAVIEARESGAPLLVLTADRPPEMRHCHAGQTIDQLKIYGDHPVFQAELSTPSMAPSRLRHLRQTLVHACRCSLYPFPGPVHLNMPFRDPLAPSTASAPHEFDAAQVRLDRIALEKLVGGVRPPVPSAPAVSPSSARAAVRALRRFKRGVIIAGPAQPGDAKAYARAVGRISKSLGWPVLADGLGPVRNHASLNPNFVTRYSAILREPDAARRLRPDCVLLLGTYPASKTLREWLEPLDLPTWTLHPAPDNPDALHGKTTVLNTTVEAFVKSLGAGKLNLPQREYLSAWLNDEQAATAAIERAMRRTGKSFESRVAAILSKSLPPGTPVFVANSMPVRDVDFFWKPNDRGARMFFNRGANGIDGTLSTALGITAHAGSAVLLTGDLALLHDVNGFLAAKAVTANAHLTIVLLNNNGGGIFESLPVARLGAATGAAGHDDLFEKFFATPQAIDFSKLAAAYGVDYHRLPDSAALRPILRKKLPASGIRLLELRCDRKRDREERGIVLDSPASDM